MTPDTERRPSRASERGLGLAIGLSLAVAIAACGNGTEPASEWETIWRNTVATVNEATAADLSTEQCQDLLGYLRVQRTVLNPVPLDDLETPVDSWFNEAEAVFFECDLDGPAAQQSLLTLEAVEGEVDVVLQVEK